MAFPLYPQVLQLQGCPTQNHVGGSPTHGREAGWRLQRSCTPSGDREEATRGWFNPSWGSILPTVSWGSLQNLLPHLLRETTLTLTRVGATEVWLVLRPNAPSLSAGNSERSRKGLAPLGSGEDRCHSLADRLAHAAIERTFPVRGQFGTVAQWPCSTWERRGPHSLARSIDR